MHKHCLLCDIRKVEFAFLFCEILLWRNFFSEMLEKVAKEIFVRHMAHGLSPNKPTLCLTDYGDFNWLSIILKTHGHSSHYYSSYRSMLYWKSCDSFGFSSNDFCRTCQALECGSCREDVFYSPFSNWSHQNNGACNIVPYFGIKMIFFFKKLGCNPGWRVVMTNYVCARMYDFLCVVFECIKSTNSYF